MFVPQRGGSEPASLKELFRLCAVVLIYAASSVPIAMVVSMDSILLSRSLATFKDSALAYEARTNPPGSLLDP